MSYVLTEIALEMLGYKFYDINGKYAKLSFQENGPEDCEPLEEEVDLVKVLELDDDLSQSPTSQVMPSESTPQPVGNNENLTIMFEHEYAKLCKEVVTNHVSFLQANKPQIYKFEMMGEAHLNTFIAHYIQDEQKMLDRELLVSENFRQNVENNLVRLDPKLFKDYARSLKSNLQDEKLKMTKTPLELLRQAS